MTKVLLNKGLIYIIIGGLFWVATINSCAYYNTFYNAQQYFEEALKGYKKEKDSKMSVALRRKFDSAIEKANKVIIEYPDSRWTDDALYIIALSYYYKGDYIGAKKKFEEFIMRCHWSELLPEMEIWYGRNLWKMGEYELALHHLRKISTSIDDPLLLSEVYYAIAELFQEQNDRDSSLFYFTKVTKLGKGEDIYAEAQFKIAEIYLERDQIQKAVDNLKRVSRYSPPPELKDQMQILLAKIYRESGRYDEARELIMVKLNDPENENIWKALELELALIYLAEEDYESAMSRFSHISETYKRTLESAEAYRYRAKLNMTYFHDYEKAQNQFDMVSKEDPKSKFALEAKQKSLEIKRFFKVKKNLDASVKQIMELNNTLTESEDKTIKEIDENISPEDLKKAVEKQEMARRKQIDTLAVFADYYKNIYEMAELYYFNFQQVDSAVINFEKIAHSNLYNPYIEKAFYALYYVYDNEQDSVTASFYKNILQEQYPDSPYLSFIEKKEIILPKIERDAEKLYIKSEDLFNSDPDSAITFLISIHDNYPLSLYGEKSVLSIAWLYQHRIFNIESSISWYQSFMDFYPNSPFFSDVQHQYNELSDILANITADTTDQDSTEIIPPKLPSKTKDLHVIPENTSVKLDTISTTTELPIKSGTSIKTTEGKIEK